jgi:hypothetical protein
VIGFEGPEWATAYENLDLTAEAVVELTPTADIATNDGTATGYLITATTTGQRGWSCCVQVPDSLTDVELVTLVGAAAIDPDDITAGLILTADERAALDAATAMDADNPIATIADVESGVAGVASFEGRTGAVTAAAGDYQASEIGVDASGFNGNLAVTDVTVQMVAQKLDDLVAGGGGAIKLDDLLAPDDNTDLNVSTSAHGLAPKAVAPAAGALNAYGIANGETAIANKTIFDGLLKVVVTTRAAYDALGPGRPSTTLYICNG